MEKEQLLKEINKLEKAIKKSKLSSSKDKLKIEQFHLLKKWKSIKVKSTIENL